MADYIFEKSNLQHPAITVIQNGKTTPFPLGTFVSMLNSALDLTNANSEFYAFMSMGITSTDELNYMCKLCNTYSAQHSELLLKLRNNSEKVSIPDKDFFLSQLETIKSEKNNSAQMSKCQSLYRVFKGTLERCIERNNEAARSLKLPPIVVDTKTKQ